MALPIEPVTLSVAEISELHQKIRNLRHDVNNKLTLISASVELVRRRPEDAERLLNSIGDQPRKISAMLAQFCRDAESALRITGP